MKRIFFYAILTVLFLGGCSTKKVFEPEKLSGSISFDGTLAAKITDAGRDGATLDNGQVITKDGILSSVRIPKGYRFISKNDNFIIAASDCGDLVVYTISGKKSFYKKFDSTVASAALKDDLLAIVFAVNKIAVFDMKKNEFVFEQKLDNVYAVDARVANPYFLDTLLLFPSLDGRLLVLDLKSMKVLRDVVVSSDRFFNNIMFLDVVENRLVASTANRIISINPKNVNFLDIAVRDIIFLKNRLFIFTKDGQIVLANADLKVLKKRKYPFAHFSGVIFGKFVYAVEKGGYLVAIDKDLITSNIYEIPTEIESFIFTTKDTIYYDDKYFRLSK